jgi:hypothetical protein
MQFLPNAEGGWSFECQHGPGTVIILIFKVLLGLILSSNISYER